MPIQAVRITMKGQQAVRYLTAPEAPSNQKRPTPVDDKVDKLSLRKATILAVINTGAWTPTRKLQRRLSETGEFDEWTSKVSLKTFQAKGLGDKLTNELLSLSEDNYLTIGRNAPRTCSVCNEYADELIVVAVMSNTTWDGSEAQVKRQTPPKCRACFIAKDGVTGRALEETIP